MEDTEYALPLGESTKRAVLQIPLLSSRATPRDEDWKSRLGQELKSLIKYVEMCKLADTEWFRLQPENKTGTKWTGTCWYVHEMKKYEFKLEFELPVAYPMSPFELVLPELDGKTPKMYRGGKICLSTHFKPLWSRNVPRFGIAHALALGVSSLP